jgi:hypothetical protein
MQNLLQKSSNNIGLCLRLVAILPLASDPHPVRADQNFP